MFGNLAVFENPKPVGLLQSIIQLGGSEDGIVLDFFAGSGRQGLLRCWKTSWHGYSMRYIMVQLRKYAKKKPSKATRFRDSERCV